MLIDRLFDDAVVRSLSEGRRAQVAHRLLRLLVLSRLARLRTSLSSCVGYLFDLLSLVVGHLRICFVRACIWSSIVVPHIGRLQGEGWRHVLQATLQRKVWVFLSTHSHALAQYKRMLLFSFVRIRPRCAGCNEPIVGKPNATVCSQFVY
jgi:hypothetical protein